MADIPNRSEKMTEPLTEREQEILACLVGGLSNHEIAARLHLAHRTVKWYNTQIYSKLGVNTREAAVAQVQALGLLAAEQDTPDQAVRNNLPVQMMPFIGRQHELADIASLLAHPAVRLITILAPGGMGKTRLGVSAAARQLQRFADGVFFVPLAHLSNAGDIVTTIADNIGFSFYGENSPQQQLIDFLKDRAMLLVLDNFEHLIDGAPLVADMVRIATGIKVLTTSRERLNLHSETVYALRGFDFSTWETPEDALAYDAVRLFMQSARRVRPAFELQAHDLAYLARICRMTGAMPLGIELAAGWVDVLSLEQIATEIQQGIDILETDIRDVPERQRSIRATFEYTWSRVSDDERAIFSKLSVFRGGFNLPAAQIIAGANTRHLRGLAQKALIQTESSERFAIHELLRQFGAGKLEETGELPIIQARHTAFFADFMQTRQGELFTRQQFDALDQIQADFENVRSAWNTLVDQQAFNELPKFLESLWFFFDVRTRCQEGVELFETTVNTLQSLPTSDVTELTLARLWTRLAWFYNDVGLSEKGKVIAESAIRLLGQHDSPEDLLAAYRSLCLVSLFLNDREITRRMAEAGYELARKLGDRSQEAQSLQFLSAAASMSDDDMDTIMRLVGQARAIYEALGDQWGIMQSHNSAALSAFRAGDFEQTKHEYAQRHKLAKAFGSAYHIADSVLYLGMVALRQRDYSQAWDLLRQSLRTFWDAGYTHFALAPVLYMAELLLHESKAEPAVEILALIDSYPAHHPLFEINRDPIEKVNEELKAKLGPERFAAAWLRGQQREFSTVIAELLAAERSG